MSIPRFGFPAPRSVARYATLWWWENGPVTPGEREGQRYFWERLNSCAPMTASPECILGDTVVFRHGGEELCRCTHYDFIGLSDHLLGDLSEGQVRWYSVTWGQVVYAYGHWWMRWEGSLHRDTARMMNPGWKAMRNEPVLAKKHKTMRVDCSGLFRAYRERFANEGHDFLLNGMLKHLEELASRYYAGDSAAVDEFLQLYCLDEKRPKEEAE